MARWPGASRQIWLRRAALLGIAALAGVLYAWAMGQDTLEIYYGAADRSMSMSWHNFIFGAFDPAGTLTVDKLPGALWLQALSVRAFGFGVWAIVLPQVIEGILTVLVLYRAVARLAGPAAGLIAALVLAVSPATVALNRENISDSLLILLLVLAADSVSAAIAGRAEPDSDDLADEDPDLSDGEDLGDSDDDDLEDDDFTDEDLRDYGLAAPDRGMLGRLVLAGVWVGLAFQAKEIEAWMVLPSLGLAYLLAGPGSGWRRTSQLVAAGVVVVLVSLSWVTAVSLVPAASRPYVDGSHNDSVFSQVFAYNGFSRFGDQTPLAVLATELDPSVVLPLPPRSADRLLHGSLGRDTGWLIPAAALITVWGIVSRRRQPRGDPLRACFILWGGWLVTFFIVFSVITLFQPYYMAALSPALAAIIGAGVAAAWSTERAPVRAMIGIAAIVAVTSGYAAWLVSAAPRAPGWLLPLVIAAGVIATGVILASALGRLSVPFSAVLGAGLVAVALTPAVASVSLVAYGENAFDTPFESAKVQDDLATAAGRRALAELPAVLAHFQGIVSGSPYVMAAQSVALPSVIIYGTGEEALPIGGLDGTIPSPTLTQVQADVAKGLFHLAFVDSPTSPALLWLTHHCVQLSKRYFDCGAVNGAKPPSGTPQPTPAGVPSGSPAAPVASPGGP